MPKGIMVCCFPNAAWCRYISTGPREMAPARFTDAEGRSMLGTNPGLFFYEGSTRKKLNYYVVGIRGDFSDKVI
jgi:hypothetical protein